MQIFAKYVITLKYLKLIEVQCNVLFLLVFGGVRNERKIWENVYLSIETPKDSRVLKHLKQTPVHFCSYDVTLQCWHFML